MWVWQNWVIVVAYGENCEKCVMGFDRNVGAREGEGDRNRRKILFFSYYFLLFFGLPN